MSPTRSKTVSAKISSLRGGRHAGQRRRAAYQVHLTTPTGRAATERAGEAPQASGEADELPIPVRAGQAT